METPEENGGRGEKTGKLKKIGDAGSLQNRRYFLAFFRLARVTRDGKLLSVARDSPVKRKK